VRYRHTLRLCRLSKVNGFIFDDFVNTTFQESSGRQEGGAESKIYFTAGDAKNCFCFQKFRQLA
jgi:hypothetical protein